VRQVDAVLSLGTHDPRRVDAEGADPGDEPVPEVVVRHTSHKHGMGAGTSGGRRGVERIAREPQLENGSVPQLVQRGQLHEDLTEDDDVRPGARQPTRANVTVRAAAGLPDGDRVTHGWLSLQTAYRPCAPPARQ
jgi:hypothetical protein